MQSKFKSLVKPNLGALITTLVLAIFGTVFTTQASADCGYSAPKMRPSFWQQQSSRGAAELRQASFLLVSDEDDHSDVDPIVGFWRSKFTIGGMVTDAGFAQWHSDGTEILNSSRPPATSSFCLGVWKRVGRSTYKLNHFAINWDDKGKFVGNTNIREHVALSEDGNSYAGTLTIDQYDPSGKLVAHIKGEVTATRITIHTKLADVL
jgi:hypothetical protein